MVTDGYTLYAIFFMEANASEVEHIPVLATILAEQIILPKDAVMVDATIGHGGHSYLFGRTLGPKGVIVGLDVDRNSIQRAQLKLKDLQCRVVLICANFANINEVLGVMDFDAQVPRDDINELIARREVARNNCNWQEADLLRTQLAELSVDILDTPQGAIWRLK